MVDNLSMYNRCDYCTYPAVRGVHLPAAKPGRLYTWLCDEHSQELDEQRREEKREKQREGKVSV